MLVIEDIAVDQLVIIAGNTNTMYAADNNSKVL